MSPHTRLYIPGPCDVDEEVLSAMAQPVLRHYGPEWMPIFRETQSLLREIFQTTHDLFIVPGPASGALDMAIGSLLATGNRMIVGQNGFFGDRLMEIAESYAERAVPFTAPIGKPLDPDVLRTLLRAHPDARVVAIVHHETGTTVLNPLRELAAVVRDAGRVLLVDAVSSLGGVEVRVDEWGVDVCVTAANKCLEGPAGLAFLSVSPRAWDLVDSHPGVGHGWYLNLRTWRKYAREWGAWHPTPVTVSSTTVLGVLAGLRRIAKTGLAAHIAKYAAASRIVRMGLRDMGFEMFVPDAYAAPMVTGVNARPEFGVDDYIRWLAEEHRIAISGGLADLAGKIFRVGHLGKAASAEYVADYLAATEAFLRLKQIAR